MSIWNHTVIVKYFFLNLAQRKCDQYWPEDTENPISFNSLSISQLNEMDFETYTLRSFQIHNNSNSNPDNNFRKNTLILLDGRRSAAECDFQQFA